MRYSILVAFVVFAGCAQQHQPMSDASAQKPVIRASAQGHAECLVCKHNADLACVDVTVTGETPSYEYQGRRYYFCSTDCRDDFAKDPLKYLPNSGQSRAK